MVRGCERDWFHVFPIAMFTKSVLFGSKISRLDRPAADYVDPILKRTHLGSMEILLAQPRGEAMPRLDKFEFLRSILLRPNRCSIYVSHAARRIC